MPDLDVNAMRSRIRAYGQAMPARVWKWAVAGSIVAGAAIWALSETEQREAAPSRPAATTTGAEVAEVEVIRVEPAALTLNVASSGHFAAARRVDVSAEVSGRILRRLVQEGMYVAAGTPLFVLDARDVRLELAEAEAEVVRARAEQSSQIVVERLDTTAAAATYRRMRQAFEAGVVSQAEFEQAQRQYEGATAVARNRSGLARASSTGLIGAEQRLARARLALARTRVVAPFRGRVAFVTGEAGQQVAPGLPLAALLDDNPIRLEVAALEASAVRVRPGASVRVFVPSLDLIVAGTVTGITPQVDARTGTGRILVSVPNPDGRLMAGLFARVEIATGALPARLSVPGDALLTRQGVEILFKVERGRAVWTEVRTGLRTGDRVEVLDGLRPGDTVAIRGHDALAHGASVRATLSR